MNPAPAPDQSALPAAKLRRRRFRPFRLLFILTGLFILALLLAMFIPGLEFNYSLELGGKKILLAQRSHFGNESEHNWLDGSHFQAGPLTMLLARKLESGLDDRGPRGSFFEGWKIENGWLGYTSLTSFFVLGFKESSPSMHWP